MRQVGDYDVYLHSAPEGRSYWLVNTKRPAITIELPENGQDDRFALRDGIETLCVRFDRAGAKATICRAGRDVREGEEVWDLDGDGVFDTLVLPSGVTLTRIGNGFVVGPEDGR
ncbi:MAG: hypothetical protein IPM64_13150 [Phycisphaerales bacterium]|nr:hypothetical protein [Phycisphaerales bacterium]